ncbi:MAG: glycosyltransferase [Bacteroidota bacterium]
MGHRRRQDAERDGLEPHGLVLLGPFAPYRGGIAHFHDALADGLEARGHGVTRLSFQRQYPALLFPGTSQFEPGSSRLGTEAEASGAPARVLDPLNPLAWRRAVREVRASEARAMVFPYWMSFFAPMWGSVVRALGPEIPSIALVHNAIGHEPRPGERALARFALNRCAGLLALSDRVRQDLDALGLGHLPAHQVAHPAYRQFGDPLPRAEARAALNLPAEAPVFLFFGFVRAYKGLSVLLDAMPVIREALPAARLVVAGEFYDDEAPYREQIDRLGVGDAVHIEAAYAPPERVRLLFSAADLVVQPYVSATQSGVAQVAFGLGRPVLTSDVGGLAETVGEGGLVVPPSDPGALAREAVRFIREPGLRERLTDGARHRGDAGDWTPVLDAVEALAEGV